MCVYFWVLSFLYLYIHINFISADCILIWLYDSQRSIFFAAKMISENWKCFHVDVWVFDLIWLHNWKEHGLTSFLNLFMELNPLSHEYSRITICNDEQGTIFKRQWIYAKKQNHCLPRQFLQIKSGWCKNLGKVAHN